MEGQLQLFDPATLEPYTLQDITPMEQLTLRMRMPSYFPPFPEVELPSIELGDDECGCEGCQK